MGRDKKAFWNRRGSVIKAHLLLLAHLERLGDEVPAALQVGLFGEVVLCGCSVLSCVYWGGGGGRVCMGLSVCKQARVSVACLSSVSLTSTTPLLTHPRNQADLKFVRQKCPLLLEEMAKIACLPRNNLGWGWMVRRSVAARFWERSGPAFLPSCACGFSFQSTQHLLNQPNPNRTPQTPALASVEMMQCVASALPVSSRRGGGKGADAMAPLLALPHVDQDVVKRLRKQRIGSVKGGLREVLAAVKFLGRWEVLQRLKNGRWEVLHRLKNGQLQGQVSEA